MKYIDAIEARVRAATPGPWYVHQLQKTLVIPDAKVTHSFPGGHLIGPEQIARVPYPQEYDADFIAYARTDIEVLLRVVRAASKEVEFRKGNPKSKIFRHDVMIHGGTEHQVGSPCEPCDALAALDAEETQ